MFHFRSVSTECTGLFSVQYISDSGTGTGALLPYAVFYPDFPASEMSVHVIYVELTINPKLSVAEIFAIQLLGAARKLSISMTAKTMGP